MVDLKEMLTSLVEVVEQTLQVVRHCVATRV